MATYNYYFNGHVSHAYDVGDVTNPENIIDGSTATVATFQSATYSDMYIVGTTAPTSGNPISQVRLRIHDGSSWAAYTTLTAPSGGWTWTYLNSSLAIDIYGAGNPTLTMVAFDWDDFDPADNLTEPTGYDISKIEIEVTTTDPTFDNGYGGAFLPFFM